MYRLDTRTPGKADVDAVIKPISLINDQTWTRDRHIFYTSEGDTGCIHSYKFDLVNGIICKLNKKIKFTVLSFCGIYANYLTSAHVVSLHVLTSHGIIAGCI